MRLKELKKLPVNALILNLLISRCHICGVFDFVWRQIRLTGSRCAVDLLSGQELFILVLRPGGGFGIPLLVWFHVWLRGRHDGSIRG